MKASIVESVIGIFGFNENEEIVEKILFPKDAEKIANILGRIQSGEVPDEVVDLIKRLQAQGYETFSFESETLAMEARRKLGIKVEIEKPSKAGEKLRKNLGKIAVEARVVNKPEDVRELIQQVSVILTRIKVRRAAEKRDLLLIQAIQALDDLDKTLNLFAGRVREWYGLHFPELSNLIDKHETYLKLVANLGWRSNFTSENLEKEGLPKGKIQSIANSAQTSMGADINDEDLKQIQELSMKTLELYRMRRALEDYIDTTTGEVAPNIKNLVGAPLGARLISIAGGLQNLAKMPASTIQVLGAEKALFRALRTGAKPPKHGIIFQHPSIHQAQKWQRGKIARALAGKIAIGARIDAFTGKYVGEELRKSFEERANEIMEKYKREKQPRPPRREHRGGR
ncbi:C/D box methylation guide ribonucleoprotein complex aNOP56 subunit [Candidatus Bathyarchaeota archaeon]|nr:C/D box methylation guide ribonucleoprotein complex aNOP56 subunit [Candidatus Bathyarchaeota archaeon]